MFNTWVHSEKSFFTTKTLRTLSFAKCNLYNINLLQLLVPWCLSGIKTFLDFSEQANTWDFVHNKNYWFQKVHTFQQIYHHWITRLIIWIIQKYDEWTNYPKDEHKFYHRCAGIYMFIFILEYSIKTIILRKR